MILAESVAVPNAGAWQGFAVVVMFLLFALEKVMAVAKWMRPEKREVSFSAEYSTKAELAEIKRQLDEREAYGAERRKAIYKMMDDKSAHTEAKIEGVREKLSEQIEGVHERVTETSNRISELSGRINEALKQKS